MQLIRPALLCLLASSLLTLPLLADEPGTGSVSVRLSYYENDDDDAGNPFLDETLQVAEPVVFFDYNVSEDDQVWGKLTYDWVSSASIDRLAKFPVQSGASGDFYVSLGGGWKHQVDEDNKWGVAGHVSAEYDYRSFGLNGDWTHELADRGASLKLGLGGFVDIIDIIRYDGAEDEGSDTRLSLTGSLGWYQTHSARLHGEYGAVLTAQNGFLETAYNAVVIEDSDIPNPNLVGNAPGREITEELEDNRIRGAIYNRTRYSLTERVAIEGGARLYADSWGIAGTTLEPRIYIDLIPDSLLLRLRYRFYTQTAADDFAESFTSETTYRTQDSDLGEFIANTVGAKFIWSSAGNWEYDIGADYTTRDDDLNYYLISTGIRYSF